MALSLPPVTAFDMMARSASMGGVAANQSSGSEPLNCFATHLLRYFSPLSVSIHLAFKGPVPVSYTHLRAHETLSDL
eukprot:1515216-Karenia_brevis.AAC.1